jgi:hypothetical protein
MDIQTVNLNDVDVLFGKTDSGEIYIYESNNENDLYFVYEDEISLWGKLVSERTTLKTGYDFSDISKSLEFVVVKGRLSNSKFSMFGEKGFLDSFYMTVESTKEESFSTIRSISKHKLISGSDNVELELSSTVRILISIQEVEFNKLKRSLDGEEGVEVYLKIKSKDTFYRKKSRGEWDSGEDIKILSSNILSLNDDKNIEIRCFGDVSIIKLEYLKDRELEESDVEPDELDTRFNDLIHQMKMDSELNRYGLESIIGQLDRLSKNFFCIVLMLILLLLSSFIF